MLSLPIARRELLILSRAPSTWRNRLASSFVVFAFGVTFVTMYQSLGKTEFNQVIRNAGWSLSLVCLFTGLLLTSDAITSEKREGTLGLLFLSNLSPFEILIGKFIAHSLLGFYSVLLFMPLLAVSLVFGEVLLQDVLFYIGSSLNLLFFSAAVGLFASSMLSDPKAAVWVSCIIVSFFWWGMPQWAKFLTAVNAPGWLIDSVSFLSIHFLSPTSAAMAKVLPFQSALWKVLSTQILAWSFIGLAAWLLPIAGTRTKLCDRTRSRNYGRDFPTAAQVCASSCGGSCSKEIHFYGWRREIG